MASADLPEVSCKGSTGPLGLVRFSGVEEASRPYRFSLDVAAERHDVALKEFAGKHVTVSVPWYEGEPPRVQKHVRHFHGLVTRAEYRGHGDAESAVYALQVEPDLAKLRLTSNSRIFQNMSQLDVVKKILSDHGVKFEERLSATYEQRPYIVQYRETDLNFVSRLLEAEGVLYFFLHEKEQHTLVLSDAPSAFSPVEGLGTLQFRSGTEAGGRRHDSVLSWAPAANLVPAGFVHKDYDFSRPTAPLEFKSQQTLDFSQGEIYDYPAQVVCPHDASQDGQNHSGVGRDGERLAQVRLQELQSPATPVSVTTTAVALGPGARFKYRPDKKHARAADATEYVVLQASYQVEGLDSRSGGGSGGAEFSSTLGVVEAKTVVRPARLSPVPLINGPQTALVVGPSGEEVWTDKYGRVKLRFHWDRNSKGDENSSCWVRVAQVWAGKNWGAIHVPRIGQEVIVEFLEGDPDQPIVTGRVYNADNLPPYALPAKQLQSGIKSRSSKGGGAEDFNELRFDDTKGSEEVYFHAQKDMHEKVEECLKLEVGKDQTDTVTENRTTTIEKGNEKLTVSKGNRTTTIEKGNDELTVSSGNLKVTVSKGQVTVTAKQSILLEVGSNSVKIDTSGITIKGMQVQIEGSSKLDAKSPMTTVNGDGMLTLKGGIVKVN